MSPKQLFGAASDVVRDNVTSSCCRGAQLRYLDGLPEVKVVLQEDCSNANCVSVISGGGAGHEPAHAAYVGSGMLAAAVVGEVFASPSAEAVLQAVRAVTGPAGCLIIIMNYTGDRLNFGMATELAKAEGLKVDLLIVGDDCALPGTGLAGRRGIAGSVLINKIAGAAAAAGLVLEEVKKIAEEAAGSLGSMGMATQICRLPGQAPERSLEEDEVEMGLGIHGEPGAYKRKAAPADELVKEVLTKILQYMEWPQRGEEYALLLNNMGTTSNLEMGVLLQCALTFLAKLQVKIVRVYSGTFMTATTMSGFSLSLLKLQERWKQYLDAEVKAVAWPNVDASYSGEGRAIPLSKSQGEEYVRPDTLSEYGQTVLHCLQAVTEALINSAEQLDAWDRSVGDGDCGTTVKRGALAIQEALKAKLPLNDSAPLCQCLAQCVSAMGGTSGAVYNIFLTAAAGQLPKMGPASAEQISNSLEAGAEKIIFYGGAKEGSRTMLDALLPAIRVFSGAISSGRSIGQAIREAAQAAEEGAEATKTMRAAAGRSSYIPSHELEGIPDPGAKVVSIWLEAISHQFSS